MGDNGARFQFPRVFFTIFMLSINLQTFPLTNNLISVLTGIYFFLGHYSATKSMIQDISEILFISYGLEVFHGFKA